MIDEQALRVVEIAERDEHPMAWIPILRRAARILGDRYCPLALTTRRAIDSESERRLLLPSGAREGVV